MTTTPHPAHQILKDMGYTLKIIRKPSSKEDISKDAEGRKHFAYEVSIEYRKSENSNLPDHKTDPLPYKMGVGHVSNPIRYRAGTPIPPTVAEVIWAMLNDSEACGTSFAEWCDNFGYDEDSRKAFDVYTACQKSGDMIKKFLGKDIEKVREALEDF